ncbi:MAG: triose-phosphate isomerase [Candidatus Margulisiibacteriota bacterium]
MRKVIIAGNWKMFTDLDEAAHLVKGLKSLKNETGAVVVICPPFTHLTTVKGLLETSDIKLGAQNLYPEEKGAFTGEISAMMLRSVGCHYVIIGHSERRQYFEESNEFLNRKVVTALTYQIITIYCVGETLEQRETKNTLKVIKSQLVEGLKGIDDSDLKRVVIAYEPVWAIGTGKTASPEQAEEVHAFIRQELQALSSQKVAEVISILYGGSVKPENISELMKQPNIDGALVGGASLKADSFGNIINY